MKQQLISDSETQSVRKQTSTTVQGARFRTVPTNGNMCAVGTMVPVVHLTGYSRNAIGGLFTLAFKVEIGFFSVEFLNMSLCLSEPYYIRNQLYINNSGILSNKSKGIVVSIISRQSY
jgi:hypothetical protein